MSIFAVYADLNSFLSLSLSFPADAFDYLDAPVFRVTGADIPTPYAKNLEEAAFPTAANVVNTIKKQLNLA